MKLSEWKLYSIYALGHILQGSPEADEKYLKILFKYLMGKECNFDSGCCKSVTHRLKFEKAELSML